MWKVCNKSGKRKNNGEKKKPGGVEERTPRNLTGKRGNGATRRTQKKHHQGDRSGQGRIRATGEGLLRREGGDLSGGGAGKRKKKETEGGNQDAPGKEI